MASLASVMDETPLDDVDDIDTEEPTDMKASAEEVMAAVSSGDVDALMSALEAFVLSVK